MINDLKGTRSFRYEPRKTHYIVIGEDVQLPKDCFSSSNFSNKRGNQASWAHPLEIQKMFKIFYTQESGQIEGGPE